MDDRLFRNTMGNFATGITVVTTEVDGEPFGMTANAFTSVSLDPKLVLVSIDNRSNTLTQIQTRKEFAISFLTEDQEEESMRFAGQLKDAEPYEFERFESLPVIKDALATISCKLYAEHVAGDHTLVIGEVTNINLNEADPLLFFQGKYRKIKEQ